MVARSYMTVLTAKTACKIATARGGNVIGGGDWSEAVSFHIVRAIRDGSRSRSVILERHGLAHRTRACYGYLARTRLLKGRPDRGENRRLAWRMEFGPTSD